MVDKLKAVKNPDAPLPQTEIQCEAEEITKLKNAEVVMARAIKKARAHYEKALVEVGNKHGIKFDGSPQDGKWNWDAETCVFKRVG